MLDTNLAAPSTQKYPAVVEVLPGHDPDHGARCRLYHRDGWCDAWTWLALDPTPHAPLRWGIVTTLEIGQRAEDLLLVDLREDVEPPLSDLLPEQLCPIPCVVRQTTRLIDGLRSAHLRQFMTQALLQLDALHGYWTSPASRRDHHAYPGGLAQHSLEVATLVASADPTLLDDRELGIVFALLHDFGKIWCYDRIAFDRVSPREHEGHGLQRLEPDLRYLTHRDPQLGAQMRELLGGPRAPRDHKYPLAIGRVVRAFDQKSCEKTRKVLAESRATFECSIPF
jgi:3'-5' exoribonuclease